MKTEAKIHANKHAKGTMAVNGKYTHVYGVQLESGDKIQEGDVYESSTGFWDSLPMSQLAGCELTLNEGVKTVWVRPCKDPDGYARNTYVEVPADANGRSIDQTLVYDLVKNALQAPPLLTKAWIIAAVREFIESPTSEVALSVAGKLLRFAQEN